MSLEAAAVTIRGLLFADVFAHLLQLKAHCGHCVSTGPEVLAREIPLFATRERRLPTNNRINVALKIAASSLRTSNTYLGAQFRRLRTRLGAPIAIKAMAAKLARLVYRMLRYGMKYVDQGAAFYELKHRELQVQHLKSKAAKLGYTK